MWELSKKYGVDFEALKAANSHISSPDMVMPGMKIRIPTTAKTVKKEAPVKEVKEVKKEAQVETPFKDISPKPIPVIKEDDEKPEMVVKPELPMPQMPQIPQMTMPLMQSPTIEQEQYTTYMTFNFDESSESKESLEKGIQHTQQPQEQPVSYEPMYQPMYQPAQMVPCYPVNPCWGMHPMIPMQPVTLPAYMGYPQKMPMVEQVTDDCGCGGAPKIPPMGEVSPFDSTMFQGQPIMPQFDPTMMQGAGQPMPQFDATMMQGTGQPMMPQFDPNMVQGQGQAMMPQFDPSMFQGQANMPQMEPNMTYPSMSGFPNNGFPTPPGFGELRTNNEEESSD